VCKKTEDETGQQIIGRGLPEGGWATEWARIIVEHSLRAATFEEDRLNSLHRLARELTKAKNNSCKPGTYFFGTWLVDIPEYFSGPHIDRTKRARFVYRGRGHPTAVRYGSDSETLTITARKIVSAQITRSSESIRLPES
jgi:hypothetical protein